MKKKQIFKHPGTHCTYFVHGVIRLTFVVECNALNKLPCVYLLYGHRYYDWKQCEIILKTVQKLIFFFKLKIKRN